MNLDTTMELDDLKTAWQALDRRLALDNALRLDEMRERKTGHARSSLRPLFWGQLVQMAFGLAILLLGVSTWIGYRSHTGLFVAGLTLHVYGVLTMAAAGQTLHLIRSINYAAPVLEIQQRLLRLRRWHVGAGAAIGLAWAVLWLPFLMCLGKVDLWARAPSVIWISGSIGLAILIGVAAFHLWLRAPGREGIARKAADSAAGRSIVRAQAVLDDWSRIEREP